MQNFRMSDYEFGDRLSFYKKSRSDTLFRFTLIILITVLTCIPIMVLGATIKSRRYSLTEPTESLTESPPKINSIIPEENTCYEPGCIKSATTILSNMDSSINPCDDFYKFVCGGYMNSTTIPDDQVEANYFTIFQEKVQSQLRESIETEDEPNEIKPFKLVKTLYKTCMNESAIEAQDLEPLKKLLNDFGGWPILEGDSWNETNFDWRTTTRKFSNAGIYVHPFSRIDVTVDPKNNTRNVIRYGEAELNLDRTVLMSGFSNDIVQLYYRFIVDIAVIMGADKEIAARDVVGLLYFEMFLASITLPGIQQDKAHFYEQTTMKQLITKYPEIPWREYLPEQLSRTISDDNEDIGITHLPNYNAFLEALMSQTPKRMAANYAMWHVVSESMVYLNVKIRKKQLALMANFTGQLAHHLRWQECIEVTTSHLELGTSAIYVRNYVNEFVKNNATEIISHIKTRFDTMLQQATWIDKVTKRIAREKLSTMFENVAYPDELLNDDKLIRYYENLELSDENYFDNILAIRRFIKNKSYHELRKPTKVNDWTEHGLTTKINAMYYLDVNSIDIPAGILQDQFFYVDRPKYMNYGSIGFYAGHEMAHAFDDEGRQYDKYGNLKEWLQPSTMAEFEKRTKCIIQQYGNYTISEFELSINGFATKSENVADNTGIKIAYYAYLDWAAKNPPEKQLPRLPYTPQQMFWISMATSFCTKMRPELSMISLFSDDHSPFDIRVFGALSNMPEFSKDFNCPISARMNPEKKCLIW